MDKTIPVCEPVLGENETKYVLDCLNTNWISSNGNYNTLFEERMQAYIGTDYAISCTNGTAAIHLALLALNIGSGDEVIIPDFTLIVSANMVLLAGAKPVLVDVDPLTYCIDPKLIEEKISTKTKAIMVVHMYGHPCDMPAIMDLARKYNLKVIEDCAESHGAEIAGKKVGSFGDVSCFSFYGNKIITTGEGGMILCNDREIAERVLLLRNQGFENPRFVHNVVGFNYRLSNLLAAIGAAQMERIDEIVAQKRWIGETYNGFLCNREVFDIPYEAPDAKHVYWMYGILLQGEMANKKNAVMKQLSSWGIETRSFFCPMHMQPIFQRIGEALPHPSFSENYPVSEYLWNNGFYLPSGLSLTMEDIQRVSFELLRSTSA